MTYTLFIFFVFSLIASTTRGLNYFTSIVVEDNGSVPRTRLIISSIPFTVVYAVRLV